MAKPEMKYYDVIDSPFGALTPVVNESGALTMLHFGAKHPTGALREPERLGHVAEQLFEYFEGKRMAFDLELAAEGSAFQRQVWQKLVEIPYGSTRSYGEIARELGVPGASRAVGRANATNPIAIVVPCHRVIGSNGTLTGYAGGIDMKEKLLAFEQGLTPSLF
jgi:methylated-DNA-[protein]-cysteine S-methyltransferase